MTSRTKIGCNGFGSVGWLMKTIWDPVHGRTKSRSRLAVGPKLREPLLGRKLTLIDHVTNAKSGAQAGGRDRGNLR